MILSSAHFLTEQARSCHAIEQSLSYSWTALIILSPNANLWRLSQKKKKKEHFRQGQKVKTLFSCQPTVVQGNIIFHLIIHMAAHDPLPMHKKSVAMHGCVQKHSTYIHRSHKATQKHDNRSENRKFLICTFEGWISRDRMPGLLVLWRGWLDICVYLSSASMGAKVGEIWQNKIQIKLQQLGNNCKMSSPRYITTPTLPHPAC